MKKMSLPPNLFLASGEVPTAESSKAIRESANTISTCIASMIDYLEEPLKAKFIEVKNQMSTMLAGLPEPVAPAGTPPLPEVNPHLLSILSFAQTMISNLTEAAKAAGAKVQTTLASLPDEITKALDGEVAKGTFVKKADHDKAIADATVAARSAFQVEIKTSSDRRTAITSLNSIPVPPDEFLAGPDADYTTRFTRAKTRAEELKPFKISGERLLTLCWKCDDAQYSESVALAKELAATAPSQKPNGFVQPNGAAPVTKTTIAL